MMKRCNRNSHPFTFRNRPLIFRIFGLAGDKHELLKETLQ